ncbi:MAG: hypothetical protein RLY86_3608 [Pseudomonadota bacterium]|jgi:hypothetical protein
MEIFLNDLSFHGQFQSIRDFEQAFGRIMKMREVAKRHSRSIKIHHRMDDRVTAGGLTFQQVVAQLTADRRRQILTWKTKEGPIWDAPPRHTGDDYFQCGDDIVTESAVAEAAWCLAQGEEACLVSAVPSNWEMSPITVRWERDQPAEFELDNFSDMVPFDAHLAATAGPVVSWDDLERRVRAFCTVLRFTDDCFRAIRSLPFGPGPAREIMQRIKVLEQLAHSTTPDGRTPEGERIYQDHFVGEKAWFTDSSAREYAAFRSEMTFRHPDTGKNLFCPWHGKVKSPQIRIHFAWPDAHEECFIVAYVGRKITKQ